MKRNQDELSKDIRDEKGRPGDTVRLLDRKEHGKTRALWEEVFPEDTPEFLDYYENFVADHNDILVQEEQGVPVSMLQLNPYRVHAGDRLISAHYIVAVATKAEYRHQGKMWALLSEALRRLCQNREPFTFLMPASESIYLPFGFRTVGWQRVAAFGGEFHLAGSYGAAGESDIRPLATDLSPEMASGSFPGESYSESGEADISSAMWLGSLPDESHTGSREADLSPAMMSGSLQEVSDTRSAVTELQKKDSDTRMRLTCHPCEEEQLQELAEFSEHFLQRHVRVYTERSAAYYQRIRQEQQAMHGGILLFYRGEELRGYCFTGCETCAEAWEIAVEPEDSGEAVAALTKWFGSRGQLPVKISSFLPGTEIPGIPAKEISCRPLTMIRIVNLESFAETLRAREPITFVLRLTDPLLEENQGCFRFRITETSGEAARITETSGEAEPITGMSGEAVRVTEQSTQLERLEIPELSIAEYGAYCFGIGHTEVFPQEKLLCLAPVYLNELV